VYFAIRCNSTAGVILPLSENNCWLKWSSNKDDKLRWVQSFCHINKNPKPKNLTQNINPKPKPKIWTKNLNPEPKPKIWTQNLSPKPIRVRKFFKFENPTPVATPAAIIDPTVIYPCFCLRNHHTNSCYIRKWKVTPVPGPVFRIFLTPGPDPRPIEKCRTMLESTLALRIRSHLWSTDTSVQSWFLVFSFLLLHPSALNWFLTTIFGSGYRSACGPSHFKPFTDTVKIGKPEWQVRKASHCGSKQQLDHLTRSLYYCLFAPPIYSVVLHAHPVRGESHIQRNAIGEVATISPPFYNKPHCSHVPCVKAESGTTFTCWSQHHFVAIRKPKRQVHKASHCGTKQQ